MVPQELLLYECHYSVDDTHTLGHRHLVLRLMTQLQHQEKPFRTVSAHILSFRGIKYFKHTFSHAQQIDLMSKHLNREGQRQKVPAGRKMLQ